MKKMLIIFISLLFLSFNSVNASSSSARRMDEYNLNQKIDSFTIDENNYQSNTVISKRGKLASYRSNIITPDAIIGDDDRIIIDDYRESPYSAVCQIIVHFESGDKYNSGSGFLISDNVIATAAHCFDQPRSDSGAVISIKAKFYDREYDLTNYYIPKDYNTTWHTENAFKNDYAFIEVPSNIGNKYGYFGVYSTNNYNNYLNKQIRTLGYSLVDEKNNVTTNLYQCYGYITGVDSNDYILEHDSDTVEGESGGLLGPLYDSEKKYQTYGIHNGAYEDNSANTARLFDLDLATWLENRGMI